MQISALARDGRSNHEIGAQLFISPRTVEYHLRSVFITLNIASRNELGLALERQALPVVAYFSNGGGLVQGWDISDILHGGRHYKRLFRFWDGDDTDASIVIDPQGYLYVSRHIEENVPRSESLPRDHEIGGLMKLNPRNRAHPVVWSVPIGTFAPDGGSLSTPAMYKGVVYDAGTDGQVIAVNQQTGHVYWRIDQGSNTWASPVTIDNQMILGDCNGGLHDYDVSNPRVPPKILWTVHLDGCIESTPAVWHGMLWVGSRGGQFYGIGDPGPNPIKQQRR